MIVKNVESSIGECLRSTSGHVFDDVVIVDTGSTDDTKETILNVIPGAIILDFTPENHPEAFIIDEEKTWPEPKVPGPFTGKPMLADFGAARQFGWSRAMGDYLMWLDSDDVVEGAEHIHDVVVAMKKDRIDAAMLNYDYASDAQGNVTLKLSRERIVRRGVASWHQPIHEVLMPVGLAKFYDQVNIKHRRHELGLAPENNLRNLKVLLKWFSEHQGPNHDPRMMFYLAMEERFLWPERAIEHLQTYCQHSGWDEERGVAHYLAGTLFERKGKYNEAFAEYAQAALENDQNPDPFFGAARVAYFGKKWLKCIEWTEKGFSITRSGVRSRLMHDPLDRVYRPHIYYNFALNSVGRVAEALASCVEGLRWNPNDPHLKGNKERYEKHLARKADVLPLKFRSNEPIDEPPLDIPAQVLATFAIQIWKQLKVASDEERSTKLLEALPDSISSQDIVKRAKEWRGAVRKTHAIWKDEQSSGSLRIVIWTGYAWEKWSPRSIDDGGIGGSETAAVHMARELHRLGHEVIVLSDIERRETFDGVTYFPYEEGLKRPDAFACDVFVCSRQPTVFETPWKFKASFLWVHDVHVGQRTPQIEASLLKVDRVLALSSWHADFLKKTYPHLSPYSISVTRNGIDVGRFHHLSMGPKIQNRLIYSSSPDRGLERLLDLFPQIREQVKDTELHVYYGFDNWRKSAELAKNKEVLARIVKLERKIDSSPGVHFHGRVSQTELAEAFAASKVWAYPTWFTETFCISAIEAQAAGCVPVTTRLAALGETVKHGVLLDPPSTSSVYGLRFVEETVNLLKHENLRIDLADKGRAWALQNCGWSKVAAEWESMFKQVIAEKTVNPLPRFQP